MTSDQNRWGLHHGPREDPRHKSISYLLAAVMLCAATLAGCPKSPPPPDRAERASRKTAPRGDSQARGPDTEAGKKGLKRLDPKLSWFNDNRERLDAMIRKFGKASHAYDPQNKPVAVFDWDNTVIKNDIGSATFRWMLQRGKIRQPPKKDWSLTCPYLTKAAARALRRACGTKPPPGKPLPTHKNLRCARELWSVQRGQTTQGEASFKGQNHLWIHAGAAWFAQLLAGSTPDQVRLFAKEAMKANLAAPVGKKVQYAGKTHAGYIRVYPQIKDLIATLQANGFDVWVVSASPQHVVEGVASYAGISKDRVIATRTVKDKSGRLTYDLKGCGPVADGENRMATYRVGKRCWINEAIFDTKGKVALEPNKNPKKRPVFGAGDAATDVEFLKDSVGLRLAINRNDPDLLCPAYHNEEGKWLVNPMFLEPLPPLKSPLPCATKGCKDADGKLGPCRDSEGRLIPDQKDTAADVGRSKS